MNKAVLPLLAIFLLALIASSGCVFPEVEAINIAKQDPVAASFLAAYPNAQLATKPWALEESQLRLSELREKCGPQISPNAYFYVSFTEGENALEAWVYQKDLTLACVHRSDDQCAVQADCEDGVACTLDKCSGTPKACSRERIKECVGGDGCCPQGCSSLVDSDCPKGECSSHLECDDNDPGTKDSCKGIPRECVHEEVSECLDNDNFCPPKCDYSNDNDCETSACNINADCDDNDNSTEDLCMGEPAVCTHRDKTECIDLDGYCPIQCNYKTDNDCAASALNEQRISLECNGSITNVDNDVKISGNELRASFNSFVTQGNNAGLKLDEYKSYKYNGSETGYLGTQTINNTTVVERVSVNGRAVYNKAQKESFFYFNKDGFRYEVDLLSGIPATASLTNTGVPFVSGNDDKIAIALFGKDGLVTKVNQNEGSQEVDIISDFAELTVLMRSVAKNLEGKNRETYMMRVARCDEGAAVFSIYDEDSGEFVKGQLASTGDIMFPDYFKQAVRITYLNKDYASGRCSFRYAKGTALEKIYDGEEFPLGSGSGWISDLVFDNNRLMKIVFTKEDIANDTPLKTGESLWILPKGLETDGSVFCKLKFVGLVK